MSDDRPNPLGKVAATVGAAVAGVIGVVGFFVQFGVLNQAQADAVVAAGAAAEPTLNALGLILGGLVPIVSGLVAAWATARVGKHEVTPTTSPMDNFGNKLVPSPNTKTGGAHYADDGS